MGETDISMLVYDGWPVRNADSVEPLWEYGLRLCKAMYSSYGVVPAQQRRLLKVELKEEDVPVAATPIDRAYFDNDSIERILAAHLNTLNDIWSKDAPADVDLDQVAEDILAELEQYLAEG